MSDSSIIEEIPCISYGRHKPFLLDNHLIKDEKIFSEEKPYVCELCQVCFSQIDMLERHILTHTVEKPNVCDTFFEEKSSVYDSFFEEKQNVCDSFFEEKSNVSDSFSEENFNVFDSFSEEKFNVFDSFSEEKSSVSDSFSEEKSNVFDSFSEEKPYVCELCQICFSQRDMLERHSVTHTTEKIYVSDNFTEEKPNFSNSFSEEKPYACELCQVCFSQKDMLERHSVAHTVENEKVHSGKKLHMCEVCKKSFSKKFSLKRHLQTHTREKPLSVDNQKSVFIGDALNEYSETESEKLHICEVCKKSFSKKFSLKRHLQTHTREKPLSVDNQKSVSIGDALNECSETQSEKLHICEVCEKSFSKKFSLKRHLQTHTREKPLIIDNQKSVSIGDTLNECSETQSEKLHVCYICEESFLQEDGLKRHLLSHATKKSYICNKCQKSFSEFSRLTEHIRIHTGEKPYICDICGNCFTRKNTLKKHRLCHPEVALYKCNECQQTFSQLSSLNKHLEKYAIEKKTMNYAK